MLDMHEVTGSIPVVSTRKILAHGRGFFRNGLFPKSHKRVRKNMNLSFLRELFPKYAVTLHCKDGSEWAQIQNAAFAEPITVYYDPQDSEPYTLYFATQHLHISDQAS